MVAGPGSAEGSVGHVNHNQELGARGEELAATYLAGVGYTVLERNWRCKIGELDIIADDAGQIVGVEVKTRSSLGFGHPAEAVNPAKLRRISRLARRWCVEHRRDARTVRVDVLAIIMAPGREPSIEHLIGVES
nr:YraN family protein [Paeniglutamicibacter kerguelensis]